MVETITVVILAVIVLCASAFGVWYINHGEDEDSQDTNKQKYINCFRSFRDNIIFKTPEIFYCIGRVFQYCLMFSTLKFSDILQKNTKIRKKEKISKISLEKLDKLLYNNIRR